ncbi:hypothetical protein ACFYSB_37210, partial [Streptomyces prasinus]
RLLRGGAGRPGVPAGRVPQHLRQPGPGLRAGRRLPAGGPAAVPGLLSDHPGLGHPARTVQAHVVRDPVTGDLAVVTVTEDNADRILVHDAHAASPATAFALSRLADPDTLHRTPIGVFRSVERPVYDTLMADQLEAAVEQHGKGGLAVLVTGGDTWTVV